MRAFETCQYIAECQADTAIDICQEIREVLAHHNALDDNDKSVPIRENRKREYVRVSGFAKMLQSHGRGEHILIVAHGNFFRLLMAILGDCEVTQCLHYDIFNASLSTAVIDSDGRFRVQLVNCVHHLDPEDITTM